MKLTIFICKIYIFLVFNFHGFSSNATEQMFYGDFRAIADTANFIVVHPMGTLFGGNTHFNVGGFTQGSTTDDVGFTAAMIDSISADYNINLDRVYSTGMSNGGFMSYRLACELEDKIAAIASVTGALAIDIGNTCQNSRPVSVMQIHGTEDPIVPYAGLPGNFYSIEAGVDFWVQRNNTLTVPKIVDLPDIDMTDGCTATRILYDDGDNGTEVEFYRVDEGAHTWPGSIFALDITNQDFSASEVIWDFFSRHSLDGPLVAGVKDAAVLNNVAIFPNPTKDFTRIQFNWTTNGKLSVFNLMGQVVRKFAFGKDQQYNIADLPQGIYLIQFLDTKNKILSTKRLKKIEARS